MDNPEAQWNRWIDDAPKSEAEAAAFLRNQASDPASLEEKQRFQRLAGDLREAVLLGEQPPYPGFFNEQIRRRIQRETLDAPALQAPSKAGWRQWLGWRQLVPMAACLVLLLAALQTILLPPPHTTATEVVHTYSPQPSLSIRSGYSPEANATVLRIEGAESLPEDFDFAAMARPLPEVPSVAQSLRGISRPPIIPVFFLEPQGND
ncbi:MAG TPA: hypothetical protein VMN36_11185 [Verrucomicrobiales bacterium]|nr:hypothetical protein [Verrucomicrobiales bacterium]